MATTTLSNEKIDAIADKLVSGMNEELNSSMDRLSKELYDLLKSKIPTDVLEMHKKYPQYFRCFRYVYLHRSIYFEKYLPGNDNLFDNLSEEEKALFNLKAEDYEKQRKEINIYKNRIICTLSKLRSVKRIKENFPEAYEIYCNLTDTPITTSLGLCDDIEKLRAELSKIK